MSSFQENVLSLTSLVPKGKVTTYKEIAHKLNTGAYRAVGRALQSNPDLITVPCHRVINSNGEIGGYLGHSKENIQIKINLLKSEGIMIKDNKVDLKKFLFKFK